MKKSPKLHPLLINTKQFSDSARPVLKILFDLSNHITEACLLGLLLYST